MAKNARKQKVFLHNRYEEVESAWCEPCGGREDGERLFRLLNIPFLHAKPTYGDVIAARRDEEFDGNWAWNRDGASYRQTCLKRIHTDGGRFAMIVDYHVTPTGDFQAWMAWLVGWMQKDRIVAEGAWAPNEERPGRLYLAVPTRRRPSWVMRAFEKGPAGLRFEQIHPKPHKRRATSKKPRRG